MDNAPATPARILIVDDTEATRRKLALAVQALGHASVGVESGELALREIARRDYDLVLLDIVMPGLGGFEVLERLKADPHTRAVPVLIVSGLQDDMDQVIHGINLGAVDFLPKNVSAALFNARVDAALAEKHRHDTEQLYLQQVEQLAEVAAALEQHDVNPMQLGLDNVLERNDALGNFAKSFTTLAEEIFKHERRLRRRVDTLKGLMLLFACGLVSGLGIPLARIGSLESNHPFGLTAWVLLFSALFGIAISWWRRQRRFPLHIWLRKDSLTFLIFWSVVATAAQVITFWIAAQLEASLLSIILVTEGFIVFGVAALLKIEEARFKRLLGLVAGFVGVALLIYAGEELSVSANWIWVLLALSIPMLYAAEDILVATKIPEDGDIVGAVGMVSLVSLLLLLPVLWVTGNTVAFSLVPGKLELVLILLAFEDLIGSVLMVLLLKISGPVFGSQVGYALTFAGIGWSYLLLNETLPLVAWVALAIMLLGMVLVEPKEEADPVPKTPTLPRATPVRDMA